MVLTFMRWVENTYIRVRFEVPNEAVNIRIEENKECQDKGNLSPECHYNVQFTMPGEDSQRFAKPLDVMELGIPYG